MRPLDVLVVAVAVACVITTAAFGAAVGRQYAKPIALGAAVGGLASAVVWAPAVMLAVW